MYFGSFKEDGHRLKPMSKSSEAADAEGASSSSKDEIIKGLNEDLARENKAIIQYAFKTI